ncbi:MAG TPA: phosphoenolpyruvate carboxykinase (ATP), partial [Ferruginibacter sp.]|nr:phosphoenolpyruvate carboxykinase (ATP) [Ferruginibacter sp.]
MSVSTMLAAPTSALKTLGLSTSKKIHYQLSPAELTEQTVQRGEGVLNDTGALLINTGKFTGRSPK